jgi:hypothetical protein
MPHETDSLKDSVKAESGPRSGLDILREVAGRSLSRVSSVPEMQHTSGILEASPIQRSRSLEIRCEDRNHVILEDVENAWKEIKKYECKLQELLIKEEDLPKKIERMDKEYEVFSVIIQYIEEKKLQICNGMSSTKKEFNDFIEKQTEKVFKEQKYQSDNRSDMYAQVDTSSVSTLTEIVRGSFAKLEKLTATRLTYDRLIKMEDRINLKIELNKQLKVQFQEQLKNLLESDIPMAQKQLEENWKKYESLKNKVTPTILDTMKISELRDKIHRLTKEIDALVDAHYRESVNDSARQPRVSFHIPSTAVEFRPLLSPGQTSSATDKAMSLIADLARARADLHHLRSLSPFFEQQVNQVGEGDQQPASLKDRFRDLSRGHYQTHIFVDQLGIRLATNQESLNEVIRLQEEAHRTPPSIEGIHRIEKQYLQVNDWRNKLLNVKNKLTDISDPAQSNQRASIDDLRPNAQQMLSLQKIECELKAQQGKLQHYIDTACILRDITAYGKEIRERCDKIIERSEEKMRQTAEYLRTIDAEKEKVKRHLQSLEQGDLDKATKQVYELWEKLPKDHPYFPWYLQGKYETSRKNYSSELPDSCTIKATMGVLDTLGANMSTITDKDIAKLVRFRKNAGVHFSLVPAVIKKYAGENYSYGFIGTISGLKGIVKRAAGKPVIASVMNSKGETHAIIVDAIGRDEDGLRRIYIRDSLPNSYGDHSYSLLLEDFEKRWIYWCVAPTEALNWSQYVGSIVGTALLKPLYSIKISNV